MNNNIQEMMADQTLLTCTKLTKRFGVINALDNIDLSIPRGRIIGLLGPNGSGKTTLIKLVNGLLVPTSGEVRINGLLPCPQTKAVISYLPDRQYLTESMKLFSLLDFYGDFYADFDRNKAMEMLKSLNLAEDRKLKTMSKGMKEKVQLVLVMSRQAQLYLLDEPIGGVDPASRDYILRTIINNYCENASVLLSTHLIADVEMVLDDAIFLKDGAVVRYQSVEEIRDTYGKSVDALFREVFKC